MPARTILVRTISFSPLLDGDGVASPVARRRCPDVVTFQSPSRWGRCCIDADRQPGTDRVACFSPLLDGDGVASYRRSVATVPPRFSFSPLLDGDGVASVSSGVDGQCRTSRFSPLLDGDGVASRRHWRGSSRCTRCFSPLLDGDGLASAGRCRTRHSAACMFQSPSRWGWCCIWASAGAVASVSIAVSVPFSMGTVLHRRDLNRTSASTFHVSVPFSMGTVLHP